MNLVLDGEIKPEEYKDLKAKLEQANLQRSFEEHKLTSNSASYDKLIETCKKVVLNLDIAYEKADIQLKQQIIGSIFPEKLIFDGFNYRTTRLNEAVELIFNLDKGFKGIKREQNEKNFKYNPAK